MLGLTLNPILIVDALRDLLASFADPSPGLAVVAAVVLSVATGTSVLACTGYVGLLSWVARDAMARGMDNAVLWMSLVMFTLFFGLLIYTISRPEGDLVKCTSCGNKRLQASAHCPRCGNS